MTLSSIRILPLTAAILLSASAPYAEAGASAPPNVLFFAVDDLKPALGCYGDPVALTPVIDRLASRGTLFDNAHCQFPVCGPSRASVMTSLRPEATGVMDLKTDMRARDPGILTLPQYFKNHGYTTAGIGKIYDPRCVDNKKDNDAPSWSRPFAHPDLALVLKEEEGQSVVLAPEVGDDALMDGQIAAGGIRLLRELSAKEAPFFLAVGFKKPHLPFVAPAAHWRRHDPNRLPLANPGNGIADDSGYVLHDSPEFRGYEGVPDSGPIPASLQRECLHGYYACTSYIDAQVGRLLAELDALDLTGNTIVVLWGDHGFHLGDHAMWGKHSTLEQATRVPLIIVPPGGDSLKRSRAPVELTDLFPTLCELAGLPVPGNLAGRSLVPLISGETATIREGALTVFQKKGAIGYSLRTERYRYTEWINKFGRKVATDLFDYEVDPTETRNLASDPAYAERVVQLSRSLRREAVGCTRLFSTSASAVTASTR